MVQAEDVVQQTFLKVWEKQPVILPGKERAFLYKIASDEFIDQTRRLKWQVDFTSGFELITDGMTPEEEFSYQELKKRFTRVLGEMKEQQRVVFMMSRNEGLKYVEIATRLSLSVKAVEKRMQGALDLLKKALQQQ